MQRERAVALMGLREDLRPICRPPVTVSPDRWREVGVTHWHLVRTDWAITDSARFDGDRARAARGRPTHGVARSPGEVVAWVRAERERVIAACADPSAVAKSSGLATDADWDERMWWTMRSACKGEDALCVQASGGARVAHVDAYAMRSGECGCRLA